MGFNLKSGNSTPFKMMDSSPVKQKGKTYREAYDENLEYKDEKGTSPHGDVWIKVDKYGREYGYDDDAGRAKFKKAAKAWNMKTYGTTEPTRDAKKAGISKKALATKYKASKTTKQYTTSGKGTDNVDTTKQSVAVGPQTAETTAVNKQEFPTKGPVSTTKGPVSTTKAVDTKEVKPQKYTRSQRRAKRKELKGKGFSRKERKAVVQSMRAETALAEGKEKKARRIAKRVNRKIASKRTRSASDKYLGPTSDRMVDLGL